MSRVLPLLLIALTITLPAAGQDATPQKLVFVCERGSVKSLIAASLFNKLAREQGLNVEAVSRGMAPDEKVPPAIAKSLLADGFDVSAFKPTSFSTTDLRGAVRVVAIETDVTPVTKTQATRVDQWTSIPPASADYAKARDAIDAAVRRLLVEMNPRKQ